ncbi:phosphogluconate dehydrogenase (NAD(+)-dependent, decarboxylating) [Enterococcus dispar]|uniref:6-phosphogluconate dehydrogenase (Decarboxylating) n=1 Tax=Enterococcus dispar ATCC 51266 TaxID=1139219 RepID=S1P1V5_9ENTE|nr:decarboxylating 6-phosphogluconate dehydrogenase [Enterococcus dispar]EOT41277.1 6-phosphogluconate dehydrogenase (decarboxylating) [Enterococcus dispar ATCC 51266]EOW87089.1 6-phosphogluconate dehydrogenase (decarboxylating) [Enterococcus dispar ATCC 51266]OJG37623.1 6-phosphogluconate dehydrogenase (decarboxylating) [Enterococcus dispar]
MKLALLGLGKMGWNLMLNLLDHGHEVVAYDIHEETVRQAAAKGAEPAGSAEEAIQLLGEQKIVWMMVPAGEITENLINELKPLLSERDVLIDGGNSNYKDTVRRYEALKNQGVSYVDVGTSGGMEGARGGACTMIGGDQKVFEQIEPIFKDISVENGYLYTGKSGSGHFLKMVHNGVEYGMMQAISEGFDILEKSDYDFDHEKVARVWNNGSVIRSWLMELMENAFSEDPKLDEIKGVVQASGEGKWTVETAMELQTAAPVIALSLMMRNRSLEEDSFSGKVVASLRNQFGGHAVEKR